MNKNGYFQLVFRKTGTFLKIVPPSDGGHPINLGDVRDYLQMQKIGCDILEVTKEIDGTLSEKEIYLNNSPYATQTADETMIVSISKDEMVGVARFFPPSAKGKRLDRDEIESELKKKGIKFGIVWDVIDEFLEKPQYCTDYEVAQGKRPIEGKDAEIVYNFQTDLSAKPALKEDGTVDFFNLNTVCHCKAGDLLAELHPAVNGRNGMSIKGVITKAKPVKHLSLKPGKNIQITEDGSKMLSEVSGHVMLSQDKVIVSNVFEVDDVDTATGNIDYDGSVVVKGAVRSGFSLKAKGNIEVRGIVEGAYIEAGGNVTIHRGINVMMKGRIFAGGNIIIKYIENATVSSGGYIQTEAILYSQVNAKGDIEVDGKKGFINGGSVHSGTQILAKVIGSSMGSETSLEVGVDPVLKEKSVEIYHELKEAQEVLEKQRPILENISNKLKEGIKLTGEQMRYAESMMLAYKKQRMEYMAKRKELRALEELLDVDTLAQVSVKETIYPGTKISISGAHLLLKDSRTYCRFVKEEGEVKMVGMN